MTPPPAHDAAAIAGIADALSDAQAEFILRQEPHLEEQKISVADWDRINCHVKIARGFGDMTWWGCMKYSWGAGSEEITFRFNDTGLAVRASLAQSKGEE